MSRTRAASRHLSRLTERGCCLCLRLGMGATPAEAHHLRESQGMSQRGHDFTAIALCPEHHRGATGLHGLGVSRFESRYRVDCMDLLGETLEAIYG